MRSDHAVHNSVADYAASTGDEACGRDGLAKLCSYHAHKQQAYIKLMIDINMLLTRVMEHDHVLRASRKLAVKLGLVAESQPAEEAPPLAHSCPSLEEGMLIGITQPSVAGLTSEEATLHDQLFLFWKHARVQHAKQGTTGASWLELFARFQGHWLSAALPAPQEQSACLL